MLKKLVCLSDTCLPRVCSGFFMANTAHFFGFTTHTYIKLHVTSLKRLKGAGDWFLLSGRILRVCARMGRHTDTGHALHFIFHVHIEQGQTDRRTLVKSILQVEALTSASELQSIKRTSLIKNIVLLRCDVL